MSNTTFLPIVFLAQNNILKRINKNVCGLRIKIASIFLAYINSNFLLAAYSKHGEKRADIDSVKIMKSTDALICGLETVKANAKKRGYGIRSDKWLDEHPSIDTRIKYLKELQAKEEA